MNNSCGYPNELYFLFRNSWIYEQVYFCSLTNIQVAEMGVELFMELEVEIRKQNLSTHYTKSFLKHP